MDFSLTCKKIEQATLQANRILLISHRQPDADALGSIQAFGGWLQQLGKDYVCYIAERGEVQNFEFLTDFEPYVADPIELLSDHFDLVVVFDSGDLQYAGVASWLHRLSPTPLVINIDHHFTNTEFGQINLVDADAASTSEILFRMFEKLRVQVTPTMANAMLAGIINDTYNFTNPNTGYRTFTVASRLLALGANLPLVSHAIVQNKSLPAMQFWGKTLVRMHHNPLYKTVVAVITQQDLRELEQVLSITADEAVEVTEGVANFLNNLGGVRVAVVLRELPDGKIKGSFRTNHDLIDVSLLAKMLGGGGHRKAAGFTISGQLKEVAEAGWVIH